METQTNIRLTKKHKKDVEALAKYHGVYKKDIIQMALDAFLEAHKGEVKEGYEILKRKEKVRQG